MKFLKMPTNVKVSSYFLWTVVPLHILVFGIWYYRNEFRPLTFLWIFLIYGIIGGFGLELGYHRMISHGNFRLRNWTEKLLVILGSLAFQGSLIAWVALHRNHHLFTDTEKDFQAPRHGKWSSYIGWTVDPSLTQKINLRLVKELLRSPFYLSLDRHYFKIIWSITLAVFLISPVFFFTVYFPAVLLSFHVSSVNNLIGHNLKLGKRPFVLSDWSTDVWWAALFSWGISFQNTHHYDPNEVNYGRYSSGIDPAFYLFLSLKRLGVVKSSR